MMGLCRVAITGLGAIAANGGTREKFWSALCNGESGIRRLRGPDAARVRFANVAEILDYEPETTFAKRELDTLDRFTQLALVAAQEAVTHAELDWTDALRSRTAVVIGSGCGGQHSTDLSHKQLHAEQKKRLSPLFIPLIMHNAPASQISMRFGLTGPTLSVATACASANHALGQAFWYVRQGLADVALAGGADAPLTPVVLMSWDSMRAVSQDTCRPFCRQRKGMILGEGAGVLVLESLDRARDRRAKIYGEIVGCGMSADAHHLTQPSALGAVRAMRAALADGGLAPEQIGYINAHGTGTQANDATETRAIHELFGSHARQLAVSSTKSMHGHALGGSGALEAVATCLALAHGVLPPTANYLEADPECDLDVIPNQAREMKVDYALSNSFAFGGLNAVLALRAFRG